MFPGMSRRISSFTPVLCVFISLQAAIAMVAADWPEFRGPDGQGHAAVAAAPLRWSDRMNVTWKRPVPGQGWSSPVLFKNRIFLTTAVSGEEGVGDGKELSLRVICFDAPDGGILWDREVFVPPADRVVGIHRKNSHASPTPLVMGETLFVHFGHLGTASLDLDGRVLWRNENLFYPPVHGGGGSPIVVGNHLIFSCDGGKDPFVVALKTDTGEVAWRVNRNTDARKTFSFSTPLHIRVDGRDEVISPGSNLVAAFDPADGTELWRVRYDGYSVIPRPVYGHGLLYIGTGYDRPTVIAIRPGGSGDVTDSRVVWRLDRNAPHTPSLLLVDTELYMLSDGGIASCVDALTGRLHWRERVTGTASASPIFAAGRIYFQDETGLGVVIRPGKEYQLLAENRLNERTLASFAVDEGALFVRGAEHLFRIEEGSEVR